MINPKFKLQDTAVEELNLFFSSNEVQDKERGCIGHRRGDFDSNGKGFFTTWWDHCTELKIQAFKDEMDLVVKQLRATDLLLCNLKAMLAYCYLHEYAKLDNQGGRAFGFKILTEEYCYYIRCCPLLGEYNFYIYTYCKKQLMYFLKHNPQ